MRLIVLGRIFVTTRKFWLTSLPSLQAVKSYGNGIAYLTHQYYIGVKTQYGPESIGKSKTSPRINLNLINALEPILYRVFNK